MKPLEEPMLAVQMVAWMDKMRAVPMATLMVES